MAQPEAQNALVGETSSANSAVVLGDDRKAIVQLDPDHPGFRDRDYRRRRDAIAQIALDHEPGGPLPDAPYVGAEHRVWQLINAQLREVHRQHACAEYLECARRLKLPVDRIPQLRDISKRLRRLSGFSLEPVAGLVHPKVFLSTLGEGTFLSTQYIRHHSTPLYTPEPDVVHELLGHASTLASPTFAGLHRLVGRAARRTSSFEALERLGRIYWFTIEFGVLREKGQLKAYGVGLLSSAGELQAMDQAELRPLDFEAMERQEYDVTRYQPVLFCADSLTDLAAAMGDYLEAWQG